MREFALRGYECAGVELQAHLAELSRANCQGLKRAKIYQGDFLAMDPAELGAFDVITCNDVIEHVQDPERVIRVMAGMLRPGGTLFMEVPNKDCIEAVTSDGHFRVFGLTQLERGSARQYLYRMTGRDDYLEQMGELYELDFYRDALCREGMAVEVIQRHRVGSVEDVPTLMNAFLTAMVEWMGMSDKLGPLLKRHIILVLSRYQSELWARYFDVQQGSGRENFELRYLNSFWSFFATRE